MWPLASMTAASAASSRGADLDDFRALDQHVAGREIADALVHGDDDAAFDERPPTLLADALGDRAGRWAALRLALAGEARRGAVLAAKMPLVPPPAEARSQMTHIDFLPA